MRACCWPGRGPIEQVALLPGADRQIELRFDPSAASAVLDQLYVMATNSSEEPANVGFALTGDGGAVRLDASLFYRITDPAAYLVAGRHVLPALQRLFVAGTVALAAARDLDDFLVARPGRPTAAGDAAAQRAALRGDLAQSVNRRLRDLQRHDAGLGVEVTRIDLTASLPQSAKAAFDAVLTADSACRAARCRPPHRSGADAAGWPRASAIGSWLPPVAAAAERTADAAAKTAEVKAVESRINPQSRDGFARPNLP